MKKVTYENFDSNNDFDYSRNSHEKCKKYLFHHVLLTMNDGKTYDGIIEEVEGDRLTVLVGEDASDDEVDDRQFYGGYGPRRFRRFRRQFFPLAALTALALLPYAYPYPYYPPYYPYYPPYYPYY
jgi:hypothetical protein